MSLKHEHLPRQWVEGVCRSGKRGFINRIGAKSAARSIGTGLRPYRCPDCDYWHIGHKPKPVMRGEATAAEWYGR